jgi:murein DD-endopeptidase MepM/ murein hydrolase activator NlpD
MAIDPKKLLPTSGGELTYLAVPKQISLPTAKIIPSSNKKGVLGVVNLVDEEDDQTTDGVSDTVKDDVAAIRETTVKIQKIVKKSIRLNLAKIRTDKREQENLRRKRREDDSEKPKEKKSGPGLSIPLPKISMFERLKNFLGSVFVGWLGVRLLKFIPQMMQFIEWIKPIASFIGDFVSGLLDKLVTFIDIGYTTVDKIEGTIENLFGDDGKEKFKQFQSTFTKFMNFAMIAAMLGAAVNNDLGRDSPFRGRQRVGFDRSGRRVGTRAQQRYRQRFGDRRFTERFGRQNTRRLDRIAGKVPRGAADPLAGMVQKGVTKVAGKTAGKIAGKIPIVGPLIDFGIRAFVFKEPLGKAAAGAVGAGVGQALGTWLGGVVGGLAGSVVPIVGNLLGGAAGATLGGLIGGVIGDQIGASLYNVIAGKEDSSAAGDLEKKATGGTVGEEESERQKKEQDALREKIRKANASRVNMKQDDSHLKKPKQDPKKGNIFQMLFGRGGQSQSQGDDSGGIFGSIRKAVRNLKRTNSSLISKIMAMGIDLLGGKKPDKRAIRQIAKSLTNFFDAAIPAPIFMLKSLLQKLATGGMVIETPLESQRKMMELSKQIERSFLKDVNRDTSLATSTLNKAQPTQSALPGVPRRPGGANPPGGSNALPTAAGATVAATAKVTGVSGSSGTVAYAGREGAGLSVSYSPFAAGSGAVITSGKGYRRSTNSDHKGYDVGAPTGTPMYAYLDGEVTHTNTVLGGPKDGSYGYWIVWKDSTHGAYHFFGHLNRPPALNVGAKFKAGALLAEVGGSGAGRLNKYAPHLHWEISNSAPAANGQFSSYVDPGQWVNTHGKSKAPAQVASGPKKLDPGAVSSKASYEKNEQTIALVEKTRVVRTNGSVNTSGRSVPSVLENQQTISATAA